MMTDIGTFLIHSIRYKYQSSQMQHQPQSSKSNQVHRNSKQKMFWGSSGTPTTSNQQSSRHQQPVNQYGSRYNNKLAENISQHPYKNQQKSKGYIANKFVPHSAKYSSKHQDGFRYPYNYFHSDKDQKKPLTPTILASHSQGKPHSREKSPSPKQNLKGKEVFRRENQKQAEINRQLRQKHPQYQKLHDKLNFLEVRIAEMKTNMEQKREEKRKFIDNEIRERQRREQQRKKRTQKLQTLQNVSAGIQSSQKMESSLKNNNNPLNNFVTQVPQHKELHPFKFNPYSPKHNMYYVSQIVRAYKEDRSLARQHILSSMHILRLLENTKMATKQQFSSRCLKLQRRPGSEDKKTVVFDLDETLIHCNESTNVPYDVKLPIKFPTGEVIQAGVNIRPYTVQLLKALSKNFQIIVFTASHSCYANVVLDYLDPENKYIHHRLFREHCYGTPEGMYVKDLRVIDRSPADIVLVDNAAYSYAFQIDNGIPIIPYYEGKVDYQLKALQHYLESTLLMAKDVREVNRRTFKINSYRNYQDIEMLVSELYKEWLR